MKKQNPSAAAELNAAHLLVTIKEYFDILKTVSGKPYVPLWKLASELGLKQVWLYQFIQGNPDHFVAGEYKEQKIRRTRNNSLTENLTGEKYSEQVTDKEVGYVIHEVFIAPADNPASDAWLRARKEAHKSALIISYDRRYGHYIIADKEEDSETREHLWRNTAEKVYGIGRRFALYEAPYEELEGAFMITKNQLDLLHAAGITTNPVIGIK